jgi:hypothetical protein
MHDDTPASPASGSDSELTRGFTRRKLLSLTATAGTAASAGCVDEQVESILPFGDDGNRTAAESGAGGENALRVVIDGAPNGLQKYMCELSHTGETTISSVEAGIISGQQFQVVEGGTGSVGVIARAADLAGNVTGFEETRTLFSVEYDGSVSDVTLSVPVLTDDDGTAISPDRVRVAGQAETGEVDSTSTQPSTEPPDELVSPPDRANVEQQILREINGHRRQNGLEALTMSDSLRESARHHSSDMAEEQYLSSTAPDGQDVEDRHAEFDIDCQAGGSTVGRAEYGVPASANGDVIDSAGEFARYYLSVIEDADRSNGVLAGDWTNVGIGATARELDDRYRIYVCVDLCRGL